MSKEHRQAKGYLVTVQQLLQRQKMLMLREKTLVRARIGQCVVFGLLIGTLFINLDTSPVDSRCAAVLFILVFLCFLCVCFFGFLGLYPPLLPLLVCATAASTAPLMLLRRIAASPVFSRAVQSRSATVGWLV